MNQRLDTRILFVGNFLPTTIASRNITDELILRLHVINRQIIKTTTQQNRSLKLFYMLGDAISKSRQYDIAVVDVFSGAAFLWAELVCAALKTLNKPFILTLHGGGLPAFAGRHPRRVRRLLGAAAAVASPSKWMIESFSSIRRDIRYIPNAIEISDYPFRLRSHPEPKLCWLRAFHAIYQPWLAVEVLALLKPDFPHAELTMIGPDKRDGSYERTLNTVSNRQLDGSVSITGGILKHEVPSHLSEMEIFLNTSSVDNFPVSVIEAMACGLCVMSTNVGGIPFFLENEIDSILASPDDPSAMAGAVRRVLTEPGLAGKLSLNARIRAEAFDWSNVLDSWEELLAQVSAPA